MICWCLQIFERQQTVCSFFRGPGTVSGFYATAGCTNPNDSNEPGCGGEDWSGGRFGCGAGGAAVFVGPGGLGFNLGQLCFSWVLFIRASIVLWGERVCQIPHDYTKSHVYQVLTHLDGPYSKTLSLLPHNPASPLGGVKLSERYPVHAHFFITYMHIYTLIYVHV